MFLCDGLFGESIMAICEFDECIVWDCEGVTGVGVWFGAPSMHRMSGCSLAWHWHLFCVHVQFRSHSGTMLS